MEEDIKLFESELSRNGYVFVRCAELYGEVVCMAADTARLPTSGPIEGKVIYRLSELRHIIAQKPGPDALRTIHEVKRFTGGMYEGTVSVNRQGEGYVIDDRKARRKAEAEKRKGTTRRKTETPKETRPEFS